MGAGQAARICAHSRAGYRLALMILADECPPDGAFYACRMACQGELDDVCADCWRRYLYYAASGGQNGRIPRRSTARRHLTARFRPFCWPSGGWESLFLPASGQGGRFLMAFQGILCALPLFCGQDCPSCRLKLCPCAVSTARGLFVHKILCTSAFADQPIPGASRESSPVSLYVGCAPWCRVASAGGSAGGAFRLSPAEPPGGNRRQRQKRQTLTNKSAGAAGRGTRAARKKQRPAPQQARTQEQGQQKQPTTARPP